MFCFEKGNIFSKMKSIKIFYRNIFLSNNTFLNLVLAIFNIIFCDFYYIIFYAFQNNLYSFILFKTNEYSERFFSRSSQKAWLEELKRGILLKYTVFENLHEKDFVV